MHNNWALICLHVQKNGNWNGNQNRRYFQNRENSLFCGIIYNQFSNHWTNFGLGVDHFSFHQKLEKHYFVFHDCIWIILVLWFVQMKLELYELMNSTVFAVHK